MDRLLRGELDFIARDRRSGAAELALRAATALQAWLRRCPEPSEQQLLGVTRALLHAQPSMAPLLRLANEVALAADSREPGKALKKAAAEFRRRLRVSPRRIAQQFERALGPGAKWILATYSYSSTVLEALKQARRRIALVVCSESRPGSEGRTTAKQLDRAGIPVAFTADIVLASRMDQMNAFATGADAILPGFFVNKAGTGALVCCALDARTPVWILADTTKFVPKAMTAKLSVVRVAKQQHLWSRTSVLSPIFEPAQLSAQVRVLTERGWMTPADVHRELQRIQVSSRLRALG